MKRFFEMLRNERGEVGVKDDEKKKKKDDDAATDDDEVIDSDPGLDDDHTGAGQDDDTDDDDGSQEIDLDDPPKKHPAEIRLDKEKKKLKEANEALQQQIDDLNQKGTPNQQQQFTPITDPNDPATWTEEQWDDLAKKDWKRAVDLRAEIKARQQYEQQNTTQEFNRVLEDSKQSVLLRHPELSEVSSEKSKIYKNIVTANPEYTNMKEGPLFAMYKMEEFMEQNMGYKREDIVKAESKAREDEQGRLSRVQLTSTTGRNVSEGNKVVLTKDELDFCDLQGINPKTYAANKKKLETSGRGGIQL